MTALYVFGWAVGLALASLAFGKLAVLLFPPRTRWEDGDATRAAGLRQWLLLRQAPKVDVNAIKPRPVVRYRYCYIGFHHALEADFAPGSDSCGYCVRHLAQREIA